jgi:hypothetical protein
MTDFGPRLKQCADEFKSRMFAHGQNTTILCRLHGILGADCISGHNCLGCNFNEEADAISRFLTRNAEFANEPDTYRTLLLRFYLLVERIDLVLDIVKLIDEYKFKYFGVLIDIRRSANFIKHPGPFLLVHHPQIFLDDGDRPSSSEFQVIIDQEYVNKNYGSSEGGEKRKKLWDTLSNAKAVAVLFPDPVMLTRRFCDAIEHFVNMIQTNTVHQVVLQKRSTYESYFGSESASTD